MDQTFTTIIEPFRIHSVEPLRMTRQRSVLSQLNKLVSTCSTFMPKMFSSICSLTLELERCLVDQWAAFNMVMKSTQVHRRGFRLSRREGTVSFSSRHSNSSGPGRRANSLLGRWWSGKVSSQQHPFRYDAGKCRILRRRARDLVIPEGHDAATIHPFKGTWILVRSKHFSRSARPLSRWSS